MSIKIVPPKSPEFEIEGQRVIIIDILDGECRIVKFENDFPDESYRPLMLDEAVIVASHLIKDSQPLPDLLNLSKRVG